MCVLITVFSALHNSCLICSFFGDGVEQHHPLLWAQVEGHQYSENNWDQCGWTLDISRWGLLYMLIYRYLHHVTNWPSSVFCHPKATWNVTSLAQGTGTCQWILWVLFRCTHRRVSEAMKGMDPARYVAAPITRNPLLQHLNHNAGISWVASILSLGPFQ